MNKILILLFSLCLFIPSASSDVGDYWMARDTLKNKLKVYLEPTSKSKVLFIVSKTKSLREEYEAPQNKKWIKVSFPEGSGYVYKKSLQKFEQRFNFLHSQVADKVTIHRTKTDLYLKVDTFCFAVSLGSLLEIPISYEANYSMTIREYLNKTGGIQKLTEEQKKQCGEY